MSMHVSRSRWPIMLVIGAMHAVLLNAATPPPSPTASSPAVTTQPAATVTPPSTTGSSAPSGVQQLDGGTMYLNFDSASLAAVVYYLAEQKQINLIPHKDLEGVKVSLSVRTPLTLDRAWNVLLTLLEMNNFSIVKVDDLYRVVSSKDSGREPLPTYSSNAGVEPEQLENTDRTIRYVYFFRNLKAKTAHDILGKMIDDHNIIDNADLNACIIKDQAMNIKAAMKIVKELDIGGLGEVIRVVPLVWASADYIEKLFKDILGSDQQKEQSFKFMVGGQKESAYFASGTRVKAEPVRNSIILLGAQSSVDKIESFIRNNLDKPPEDAQSRLHIKEVRYMKAEDLKPLIEALVQKPQGASAQAFILEGGYTAFEDVLVGAEISDDGTTGKYGGGGNRLIIACNKVDWARLEKFIDKLDKPSAQVAIEMMVVDVTLDQERQLSTQFFQFFGRKFGAGIYQFESTQLSSFKSSASGSEQVTGNNQHYIELAKPEFAGTDGTFLTFGRAADPLTSDNENIWSIIKTLLQFNNSHIIYQPYLVTNNNIETKGSFSSNLRVPGDLERSTIQSTRKYTTVTASTTVTITPHINLEGLIDLDMKLTVEEFLPTSDPSTPPKSTRTVNTRSSMRAGEVLVLGGLTRSQVGEQIYKVPILSDIPVLGSLFKGRTRSKTESNLYVFIRPTIIKPSFEGEPDEYSQLKLDYAKLQIMKNDQYNKDTDPIQRWFFKPSNQTVAQRMSDARRGILRPVDDYTYGKMRPREVDIAQDPVYRASEALEKIKASAKPVIAAAPAPLGQKALSAMIRPRQDSLASGPASGTMVG